MNDLGTYILASAPYTQGGFVGSFARNGKLWKEGSALNIPPTFNVISPEYFGTALDMNQAGDISMVGSADGAWVYAKSGNSWNLVTSLHPDDQVLTSGDCYGNSVVINDAGDIVAVNALYTGFGTTWVFTYNGSSWVQDGSMIKSQDTSINYVGFRTSMNSFIFVATANTLNPPYYGAFVVFQRNQTSIMSVPGCFPKPKTNFKECKKMIKTCGTSTTLI